MQDAATREKILKKVRSALIEGLKNPFPAADNDAGIFTAPSDDLAVQFASNFTNQGGNLLFCENHLEFAEQFIGLAELKKWKDFFCIEPELFSFLDSINFPFSKDVSQILPETILIGSCENLIVRSGAITFSSKQNYLSANTKIQIIVADVTTIVEDLKDALYSIKVKYSTGFPSSINVLQLSSDNEVYLFLVDNSGFLKMTSE